MDLGSKIKNIRYNHNISQEELAKVLEINRNYLSRIETGKSEPTLSIIRNMVNYFKVDVASLMDIEGNSMDVEEKIKLISEECKYLLDNDLNFIIRMISVMREEYVKKDY